VEHGCAIAVDFPQVTGVALPKTRRKFPFIRFAVLYLRQFCACESQHCRKCETPRGIRAGRDTKLAGELDEPFNANFTALGIQPDCVGSHIRDVPQRTASFAAVAVPDQVRETS